jgi:hypothetical protein
MRRVDERAEVSWWKILIRCLGTVKRSVIKEDKVDPQTTITPDFIIGKKYGSKTFLRSVSARISPNWMNKRLHWIGLHSTYP